MHLQHVPELNIILWHANVLSEAEEFFNLLDSYHCIPAFYFLVHGLGSKW